MRRRRSRDPDEPRGLEVAKTPSFPPGTGLSTGRAVRTGREAEQDSTVLAAALPCSVVAKRADVSEPNHPQPMRLDSLSARKRPTASARSWLRRFVRTRAGTVRVALQLDDKRRIFLEPSWRWPAPPRAPHRQGPTHLPESEARLRPRPRPLCERSTADQGAKLSRQPRPALPGPAHRLGSRQGRVGVLTRLNGFPPPRHRPPPAPQWRAASRSRPIGHFSHQYRSHPPASRADGGRRRARNGRPERDLTPLELHADELRGAIPSAARRSRHQRRQKSCRVMRTIRRSSGEELDIAQKPVRLASIVPSRSEKGRSGFGQARSRLPDPPHVRAHCDSRRGAREQNWSRRPESR